MNPWFGLAQIAVGAVETCPRKEGGWKVVEDLHLVTWRKTLPFSLASPLPSVSASGMRWPHPVWRLLGGSHRAVVSGTRNWQLQRRCVPRCPLALSWSWCWLAALLQRKMVNGRRKAWLVCTFGPGAFHFSAVFFSWGWRKRLLSAEELYTL